MNELDNTKYSSSKQQPCAMLDVDRRSQAMAMDGGYGRDSLNQPLLGVS